ncbi:MAG: hypothetical protein V3U98_04035 [Acidobacteriota bacterium]
MTTDTTAERSKRRRLAVFFFAAGALALSVQVMLLRELMVALQGDETAVALGLAAWLGGIAAGAGAARQLTRRRPERWAGWGFALLAVAAPVGLAVSRLGRWALAPPPGELLTLGPAVLLALAVLAPAGSLVGLTFTALAATAPRAGWRAGQGIAWLYVLESLGSLAGGLAVTFLVIPLLDPVRGIFLMAGVWVVFGLSAARPGIVADRSPSPLVVPGPWVFILLAMALLLCSVPKVANRLEAATAHVRFRGLAPGIPLIAWADTPYQHVAIGGDSLRHLYTGGQYAGSFPDPSEHESLAHRLASMAPRPHSVLLIGGGLQGMLRHLFVHPIQRIDLVDIDRQAVQLVRELLPRADDEALDSPRVRIVTDDPRRFLARGRDKYDLILILEPPPITLLLARLSTVEFYRLCADRLAPDGVLVVRFETSPNVLTGETAALGGSLWGALQRIFPVVRAGPGPEGLLLAGFDPQAVTLDPIVLSRRFEERNISSDVFVAQLFPLLFPPERVASQEAALEKAAAMVPPSRDAHPVCFLHALALRQQVAGSFIAPLLGRVARASPRWLAMLALVPSLLLVLWIAVFGLRRKSAHREAGRFFPLAALHAVVVTGGCGMAWSLLILFSYQTRAGALYGQIGLLTALFMLGLAVGAVTLARGAELPEDRARRWLSAVTGAALLFAFLMPGALHWLGAPGLERPGLQDVLHGALLLAAGMITGALFPVAAGVLLAARRGVRATASGLEAADHVGAAAAALVGGIIFIPALGLTGTAWFLAALEGVALVAVLLARFGTRTANPA